MNNHKIKFCSLPWTELYVNSLGNYGMCCQENSVYDNNKNTVTQDHNLFWNGQYMKNNRLKFINGGPLPQCQVCWNDEALGKISMRNRRNLRYIGNPDPDINDPAIQHLLRATQSDGNSLINPTVLHFSVGSTCQLRCIECSPTFSRAILKDYKKLDWNENFKNRRPFEWFNIHMDQIKLNQHLWNRLKQLVSGATWLQIGGGEPTMSQQLFEFMVWCRDQGYNQNISVLITTNAVNIKPEWVDLLKSFKLCILVFSIDGHGELDEYIRYPTNWNKKEQIIKHLGKIFPASSINTVVTSLNIHQLPKLVEWSIEQNLLITLNPIVDPDNLSAKHLPDWAKDDAQQKIQSLIKLVSTFDSNPDTEKLYNKQEYILNSLYAIEKMLDQPRDPKKWAECLDIVHGYNKIRQKKLNEINDIFENLLKDSKG